MTIEFRPASALSGIQLTDLFNASYAGYIFPVQMTEAQMRAHIHTYDVLLERSSVAFDGDEPVGLALLAQRGRRGWVAGIGVVQSRRKQGSGRLLMNRLLENAREHGLESVQLEVIVGNDAAHNLYLQTGLEDRRDLLVIARPPAPVETTAWLGRIEPGTLTQAIAAYDRLHASAKPWQRQPESLIKIAPEPQVWLALHAGEVQAYVVGQFSDERLVFQDVGASVQHPDAVAALLRHVHTTRPRARGSLVNLDERDPAWPAFEALGYHATIRQHEMWRTL